MLLGVPLARGDPAALVELAIEQRDKGVLHPNMPNYGSELTRVWGGPPPRWYAAALEQFAQTYSTQRGRVALITGGTGGIGFYVAQLLAKVGLTVILPSRPGLLHEATSAQEAIAASVPDATVLVPEVPLDLGSFSSVRAFGAHLRASVRVLDVVCLNAARGGSGFERPSERTVDGLEAIIQVNLLAHAMLLGEVLPLMRRSAHVRIALMSSGARFNARPAEMMAGELTSGASGWAQYSKSKAGLCLLARALNAGRLREAGIAGVASAADPGICATGLNVQHDLAATLGGRVADTKALHDQAGSHASDGALTLALAALDGESDAFYAGDGGRARSLAEAARRQRGARGDPMGWEALAVDGFWAAVAAATPGMADTWKAASAGEVVAGASTRDEL